MAAAIASSNGARTSSAAQSINGADTTSTQQHEVQSDEPNTLLVQTLNCPKNPDDGHGKSVMSAALGLAIMASTPALAQKIGKHGGQTAIVAGHHDAELVIEPKRLVLYLTNHGKPLSAKDNAIKATVQEGGKKTEVKLTVDKDHLVGSLAQPLPKGAIILLSGKTEDGHGVSARFTVR